MNRGFLKKLGPGFLLAGAAIGASHLVQATRAGANYGIIMLIAIILACVSKYPFLAIGAQYPALTKKDLIQGYKSLGKWYVISFGVFTLGSMFIILAAVTLVTAGLAEYLFDFGWSSFWWCSFILMSCLLILQFGSYSKLDVLLKIVISLLTIATTIAVFIAIVEHEANTVNFNTTSLWSISGLSFLVVLMGWMPIPIDASVWQSIWVKEKEKSLKTSASESFMDFNLGYFSASFLGILFFLLGVLIMYGEGIKFSSNAVEFSKQLIELYSQTLGAWSKHLIAGIALITMFSTTLTVADAYPRVLSRLQAVSLKSTKISNSKFYNLYMALLIISSLCLLYFLKSSFKTLVDFAAGLSFISSPVLAWFNYKLVLKSSVDQLKPAKPYRYFMQICLTVLIVIALSYVILLIFIPNLP
ncbi:Mn2+ and Fe2+ transporters of the NRAMP family [Psychroflexus salarius]|uniref:Mn2+ and Fe2+ transporters of the NRAMP family n=1 Tax=Psychroflexus salarius TaxID=1155689 RepID=A0A1M4W318_9FLAO|nr:divalent metal cation transporter [Psychroflexus salarius]SHE75628.1 Mn2+ and Fe2+ transporters of the NRAMP family [Psychroflexus salarius]